MTRAALRRELLARLRQTLAAYSFAADPGWEADEILRHIAGVDRQARMTEPDAPVAEELCRAALAAADARGGAEPLGYVLGRSCFYGRDFFVCPGVLIPRADSEVLVEEALRDSSGPKNEKDQNNAGRDGTKSCGTLLDLCCGSGCLGLSVLAELPAWRGTAADVAEEALFAAAENARRLGLEDRLTVMRRDLLTEGLPGGRYDLILCNPPYLDRAETEAVDAEVAKEPVRALLGGEDGLTFYRTLIPLCRQALQPGGRAIFEIGCSQRESVCEIARACGFSTEVRQDYAGHDRAVIMK